MNLNRIQDIIANGEYKYIRKKVTKLDDVTCDTIYTIYTNKGGQVVLHSAIIIKGLIIRKVERTIFIKLLDDCGSILDMDEFIENKHMNFKLVKDLFDDVALIHGKTEKDDKLEKIEKYI
jgi:hypothetical protein